MLSYYKLRVDTTDVRTVLSLLSSYTDKYLVGFENQETDNSHCHAYIETATKQSTLRAAIRKQFGSGNGSYSLKALDEKEPLEYIAYCIKENDYKHNLPQEVIDKAKAHDASVKTEMKKKKESRKTILQKIEEKYFSHVEEGIDQERQEYVTKKHVVDCVLSYYRESGNLIRQFMLVSLCQTLCLKYVNSYEYEFHQKIYDAL